MKRLLYFLVLVFCPLILKAQNPEGSFNPYVNQGIIELSPQLSSEANATGEISFNIGNTGGDLLDIYDNQRIRLIITLSEGEPDHENPVAAIGGSSAGLFSWSYNAGIFTGVQIAPIPASSAGDVSIAYKATGHSSSPGSNGFSVAIESADYQSISNTENDDAVSSYTFMEFKDFGDAPASYGSVYHILDFDNYLGFSWDAEATDHTSSAANGDDLAGEDDEDGVVFPAEMQLGETVNIDVSVTGQGILNGWIDWNRDGDFDDSGERIAENLIRYEGTESLEVTVPEDAVISVPTFARFRLSSQAISLSNGQANGGEVEDYMVTLSASPYAPTTPENLRINHVSDDSVCIAWNASADNIGVTAYRIFRNGTLIGTSETLTFTDRSVNLGEFYSYSVSAMNAAGYESDRSDVVAVHIDDTTAPSVPDGIKVSSVNIDGVDFSWEASTDNVGVLEYRIYRSGSLLAKVKGLSYTDKTVTINNSYTYTVSAIDAAGNESALSSLFAVYVEDILSPSIPTGLSVVSVSDEGITIAWEASSDNVGVVNYKLYRLGSLLNTLETLTYTDNSVLMGETYTYTVSALDASGNESGLSDMVTVTANATSVTQALMGKLNIYPNPSDGEFVIDIGESGRYSLEIVASSGVMVYKNTIDLYGNSLPLNLGYFETGVYYVRIYNSDQNYIGKLMIVR